MPVTEFSFEAIEWAGGHLRLLDQRLLPRETRYLDFTGARPVAEAIRNLVVRGAPAIGITAAYAVVLSARQHFGTAAADWRERVAADMDVLADARPTAVNLAWALARMRARLEQLQGDPVAALLEEAGRIHAEDVAANHRMGDSGADLVNKGDSVLTYCNTGTLATGGYGTALGVVRSAWAAGKLQAVYAGETRPWLQGARLTAWELVQDAIPVTLITDNAASFLMQSGKVQWVITGADRVTANGDVINKIGTSQLAVSCRHYGVKMMVVAPVSTLDLSIANGRQVAIEQRPAHEVLECGGQPIAAAGARAWNPVFDVTPAGLVDFLVTEAGVVAAPDTAKLQALVAGQEHNQFTT
ncbi:MAG: S-methyl-5-thioribose-1-phosphate isomerase [Gammaproteobacteria bacterium]